MPFLRVSAAAQPATSNYAWRRTQARFSRGGQAGNRHSVYRLPQRKPLLLPPAAAAAGGESQPAERVAQAAEAHSGPISDAAVAAVAAEAAEAEVKAAKAAAVAAVLGSGEQLGTAPEGVTTVNDKSANGQVWRQMLQQCWMLLQRNLFPLVAAHAMTDAAVFLLHRLSHRATNEAAVHLIGGGMLTPAAIGNMWWLSVDPAIANFQTGYQPLTFLFFLAAFPINVAIKTWASCATILLCQQVLQKGKPAVLPAVCPQAPAGCLAYPFTRCVLLGALHARQLSTLL